MFAKLSKTSYVKKILVISLSNIGDVVLTCPVIDVLLRDFSGARFYVVVGPKAKSLFEDNMHFDTIVFDKHASLNQKKDWFFNLRKQNFDVIVDLRHTVMPFLLMPLYSTRSGAARNFKGHMKDKHLLKLRSVYDYPPGPCLRQAIVPAMEDRDLFQREVFPFVSKTPFVVIAPGAADSSKRWPQEKFSQLAEQLSQRFRVVFVGDANDDAVIKEIQSKMTYASLSLAGKLNLRQLAFVLSKASMAITNDSGPMHIASYVNTPVIGLFGPTDPAVYGPWSEQAKALRNNKQCPHCQKPKSTEAHNCMSFISVEDVMRAVNII